MDAGCEGVRRYETLKPGWSRFVLCCWLGSFSIFNPSPRFPLEDLPGAISHGLWLPTCPYPPRSHFAVLCQHLCLPAGPSAYPSSSVLPPPPPPPPPPHRCPSRSSPHFTLGHKEQGQARGSDGDVPVDLRRVRGGDQGDLPDHARQRRPGETRRDSTNYGRGVSFMSLFLVTPLSSSLSPLVSSCRCVQTSRLLSSSLLRSVLPGISYHTS